jgi:hypothetical protein
MRRILYGRGSLAGALRASGGHCVVVYADKIIRTETDREAGDEPAAQADAA